VQTAPPLSAVPAQPSKPAWLTPEKEAALFEVRKILQEARQVAEGIAAPSKPRELSLPEDRFTRQERNKMWLLTNIESAQFRAGDFSTASTTAVLGYLAVAQLYHGQVEEALRSAGRTRLIESTVLTFVFELAQAGYVDAAINVAEEQIKKEQVNPRRREALLFSLIAREQARLGDPRSRDSLQRAQKAALNVVAPNDRAIALVHVARAQAGMGDRVRSEETLRKALETALTAPRGRDTAILSTIAMVQEDNGDQTGSTKTFEQILEDEKNLKPIERAKRLGFRACARMLRGHRASGTEIFQTALRAADGLSANEQIMAWHETGRWLLKAGEHKAVRELVQRLVDAAKATPDEQIRAVALSAASGLATQVGDLTLALDIASTMKEGWRKADALRFIAEQLVETKGAPKAASTIQKLSDAAKDLSQTQLPKDESRADGMLANIAKIQAVTGDIQVALRILKRISNQDAHQSAHAYPQIVTLLAKQGNLAGARQVIGSVESKWVQEIPMASALQSLGRAYAEAGASQDGLQWAQQMRVDYAKASILLGVGEGIMNRNGIENIVTERPEITLQIRCYI
jgi:tetratricopeptide (TPR) repeat protein